MTARSGFNGRTLPTLTVVRKRPGEWPTPQVAWSTGGQRSRGGARKNELLIGGLLGGSPNPTWVEWLMGFPLGWTALEATP